MKHGFILLSDFLVLNSALILSLLGSIATQYSLCTQSTSALGIRALRTQLSSIRLLWFQCYWSGYVWQPSTWEYHCSGTPTGTMYQAEIFPKTVSGLKCSCFSAQHVSWSREGTQLSHESIAGPVPSARAHCVYTKLDWGAAMEFGQPEFYLLVLLLAAFVT